jgi:hypothetical protein
VGEASLKPDIGLGLADRQPRADNQAGVTVTDRPGFTAAGGVGVGVEAAAFPGFQQGPTLRRERHAMAGGDIQGFRG